MSAEQDGRDHVPQPVPAGEPPPAPPYQPDFSLITELEKGLNPTSEGVEQR
ncbi:MAG TPA: hypothetical protein VM142_05895 [Acidimicrobiales bacterium]|nr:hypothetical protein [Acidimicrobiales bacterium]